MGRLCQKFGGQKASVGPILRANQVRGGDQSPEQKVSSNDTTW